jgi:hypothetical protein
MAAGNGMADVFAEIVTRSQVDSSGSGLEIALADATGRCKTLSLSADAIAALAKILSEFSQSTVPSRECLTKIPQRYAVGHGRHEPFVLLRFEDESAYGLSPDQAANLAEALLDEAEAMSTVRYSMRQ